MKTKITNLNDLEMFKEYNQISKQFNNAENKITIICRDFTGLNRPLVYACFTDRIGKIPTEQEFQNVMNERLNDVSIGRARQIFLNSFVIWDYQIDEETGSTILETIEK